MKALYINQYGGPETMQVGEIAKPSCQANEVLIRVLTSSVNPVDWKVRNGDLAFISGKKFPKIIGIDYAGRVEEVGTQVRGLKAGDLVYGGAETILGKPGSHAEFLTQPASKVRKMPQGISLEFAGVLGVAGLTALHGINQAGNLQGKEVLILGATGGVGHLALQMAKARGARVTAVASSAHVGLARELGAAEIVDYKKEDFKNMGRRWDFIFDAHGHTGFAQAKQVLKPGGVYGSTLPSPQTMLWGPLRNIFSAKKSIAINMRAKPADFAQLEAMLAKGEVKPIIAQEFKLEQAVQAYAAQAKGTFGKILIRIAE